MGTKYSTKKFKKDQKDWYQILKDGGFIDIEYTHNGVQTLISPTAAGVTAFKEDMEGVGAVEAKLRLELRQLYYQLLQDRVKVEKFASVRDKVIMTQAANGAKVCEIIKELTRLKYKCHRQTVRFTIRKYEHKWKIKKYKPQQLTSNKIAPTPS